jgi:hypothetical protein
MEMTVASDFTISDVLAWARTKPADEAYDFCNAQTCAIAQFGKDTGRGELVGLLSLQLDEACPGLLSAVHPMRGASTFGALAERLQAMLPAKPSLWLAPQTYINADCGQVSA